MTDQPTLLPERFTRSWGAAEDDRLRFHVHTVDPAHGTIGLHIHLSGSGSPSFSLSLSAGDAATLGGALLETATVARDNLDR
jgi:hypothetical protein